MDILETTSPDDVGEILNYLTAMNHWLRRLDELPVLERLLDRPVQTVKSIAGVTGLTFSSANKIVRRLVDPGILSEITGQKRNRPSSYGSYLSMFEEPARDASLEPTMESRT